MTWRVKVLQIVSLLVLAAVALFVYTGRISTRHIGVSDESMPTCRLDLSKASANDIEVKIVVSNPTRTPVGISKRYLPQWDRISTKLFDVDRNGSTVRFNGRFVDGDGKPTDLLELEPGTEASVTVSLKSAGYDVSGHSRFAVTYKTALWHGGQGLACSSKTLVVEK